MSADPWLQVRRLLMACPGGQDVLAPALPALHRLRQALPAAQCTLWAPTCTASLAAQLPTVQELLRGPLSWSTPLRPLINAIQNRAFDAAIILTGLNESPYPTAYLCYLAGVPLRLGQSREFGGRVLSHWVRPRSDLNMEQHHLHLLAQSGLFDAMGSATTEEAAPAGVAPARRKP